MGFPRRWCVEALSATRNNVDEALTWILTNGERLSAEDEAADEKAEGAKEENATVTINELRQKWGFPPPRPGFK